MEGAQIGFVEQKEMYKSWKLPSQQNLGNVKLEEAETESVDEAGSERAAGQGPRNPEKRE